MTYDKHLETFKDLKINLVKHDNSPTGLPCYIEVQLNKTIKVSDRTGLVLDLGNYIYRTTGLSYQMTPEFRGKGKNTTIRWFMSWGDLAPVLNNVYKAVCPNKKVISNSLPNEFRSLIIQDASRGVYR